MGSGKRKYYKRQKYVPKEKKLEKYTEEKKEIKPEAVKRLLKVLQNISKKKNKKS